ncbi:hypothetical protein VPH35_072905 [Triticum aestivum]
MDDMVIACKVHYVYKSFGCERYVDQHSLVEHSSRCAHAPCYCYECMPPFEDSSASLVHHLMEMSGNQYWPTVNIKFETCYPFAMPESLEDHRRLLVAEKDNIVFLLAVGTGKARTGRRPVSVVCLRGNTAYADTRPLYWCVLTITAPLAYDGDLGASLTLNGIVTSCSVPGNVDMEEAWHMHYRVNCSSLVFAQCKSLSKHVDTSYLYSIEPSMHDLALLEYRT